MAYTVTRESFVSLTSCWADPDNGLKWAIPFVLPPWLQVWWQTFSPEAELYLAAVSQEGKAIGIAPLMIKDSSASIVGSADVCDYLDFIIAPGREHDFFKTLLDDLKQKGVSHLDLVSLRPDSAAISHLVATAEESGCRVTSQQDDVSLELDLPTTWDEYLGMLKSKQRHEVGRKIRRLEERGKINYRVIEKGESVPDFMAVFIKLFSESRPDKAVFMTEKMRTFFTSLAEAMAEAGLLRSAVLELNDIPVAAIMGFDYNNTLYLYNSGYDPEYSPFSVGILSKVLCIKDSIQTGKKRFDFLKGGEHYKYHLGGREVPIYSCQIATSLH